MVVQICQNNIGRTVIQLFLHCSDVPLQRTSVKSPYNHRTQICTEYTITGELISLPQEILHAILPVHIPPLTVANGGQT